MSSEWPTVSLGDCIELDTGFPFKSVEYSDSEDAVRLLRGDNIGQGQLRWDGVKRWTRKEGDALGAYELRKNDLVLAMDRPWIAAGLKFAKVRDNDLPALLVQRVARLRPKSGIDVDYLHSVVSSPDFTQHIQNVTTGTAVPHISGKQIQEYKFALPDLAAQISVGKLLMSLDDRIALLRETNATLEAIAQALFKSWFVDFDPVHAKQQGRVPEGMDEATAALFPDSFEESALGLVPKGWGVSTFQDCCARTESGGTPKRTVPEYWNGNISWLTSGEVRSPIVFETKEKITDLGVKDSSAKLWPSGTTVIAMYGATAGEVCLLAEPSTANQACCGLIPKQYFRTFLFMSARREQQNLASKSSGSAQQNLNKGLVSGHPVLIPTAEILERYEAIAGTLLNSWSENERQAQTLATLRDTLLPRLISGQLCLPDAEAMLDEVGS